MRRREAERFRSGEADVLVATDAIGLGLNLPIRRIVFASLEKFDGVEHAPARAGARFARSPAAPVATASTKKG